MRTQESKQESKRRSRGRIQQRASDINRHNYLGCREVKVGEQGNAPENGRGCERQHSKKHPLRDLQAHNKTKTFAFGWQYVQAYQLLQSLVKSASLLFECSYTTITAASAVTVTVTCMLEPSTLSGMTPALGFASSTCSTCSVAIKTK